LCAACAKKLIEHSSGQGIRLAVSTAYNFVIASIGRAPVGLRAACISSIESPCSKENAVMRPTRVIGAAIIATILAACRTPETQRSNPAGTGSTSGAASSSPSGAPSRPAVLHRVISVYNHPDEPAPDDLAASVGSALVDAGCGMVPGLDCEMLVVCRSRPRNPAVSRTWGPTEVVRTGYLSPRDHPVRVPPDWELTILDSRWLAVIDVEFETWKDFGDEYVALAEISIHIGTQGLDGPEFTRREYRALWRVLDDWAAANSGARR
jgi:hypothetical protein